MGTLNLIDIINSAKLQLNDVVAIRHAFNKKENSDVWDKYDRSNFEEYQSIQPTVDFFKNRKYVLSFIADGKNHARFVGCYEIISFCEASKVEKKKDFPHQDFYNRSGHIYLSRRRPLLLSKV